MPLRRRSYAMINAQRFATGRSEQPQQVARPTSAGHLRIEVDSAQVDRLVERTRTMGAQPLGSASGLNVVAFSGGVDSSLAAYLVHEAFPHNSLAAVGAFVGAIWSVGMSWVGSQHNKPNQSRSFLSLSLAAVLVHQHSLRSNLEPRTALLLFPIIEPVVTVAPDCLRDCLRLAPTQAFQLRSRNVSWRLPVASLEASAFNLKRSLPMKGMTRVTSATLVTAVSTAKQACTRR